MVRIINRSWTSGARGMILLRGHMARIQDVVRLV